MVNVVVDTSVLIEEIRQGSDLWQEMKKESRLGGVRLFCPSVVLAELWAGKSMARVKAIKLVERMIEVTCVVDLKSNLAKKAGEIIREYNLSGFDAVVAATALAHKAKLATLNKKHFVGIKGLRLYNE